MVAAPAPARGVSGRPRRETTSWQRVGMVVAGIGVAYMLVVGCLVSWLFASTARGGGMAVVPTPILFGWMLSVPLGAVLATVGAAMAAQMERQRLWLTIGVGVTLVAWFAIGIPNVSSPVVPALYGTGGVLIVAFFLATLWDWMRTRSTCSPAEQLGGDLHVVGSVFYLAAAWLVCGLLGAPFYLLRPELAQATGATNTVASTVLVFLTLGWALTFLGRRVALRRNPEVGIEKERPVNNPG